MPCSLINFVALFLAIATMSISCTLEKRIHRPGFHLDWKTSVDSRAPSLLLSEQLDEAHCSIVKEFANEVTVIVSSTERTESVDSNIQVSSESHSLSFDPLTSRRTQESENRLLCATSSSPDTLKKPFKPQQQYREVDPVGKASVIIVLAGVALQKIACLLTWYEVVMPLMMGPGIFIPALIVALIGVGLSAYSAYRVRKFPEKYKKNELGKAALAILGWQILMTVLFAWLLV